MKLSWKPHRNGNIYCSPACGSKCTWDSYLKANKLARELAKSLGEKWTTRVWENLGWHYCAISPCKRIKVHPHFTAFLGDPDSSGGRWAEYGKTAKASVRNVINSAKKEMKIIESLLISLPSL